MTLFQQHALANPLARASGDPGNFRRFAHPWSIVLTVNK